MVTYSHLREKLADVAVGGAVAVAVTALDDKTCTCCRGNKTRVYKNQNKLDDHLYHSLSAVYNC